MQLPKSDDAHPVAARGRDFIQNAPFPCVGARSPLSRGRMKILVARAITSGWDDTRIDPALLAFIYRYRAQPSLFPSFVVLFEAALWDRIRSLFDKDRCLGQTYDTHVASDPEDPHVSLSLGGQGFFVVGLHPGASRRARRFETPALVFNLHDPFERLRAEGRDERPRAAIVDRDVARTGSINPLLAQHGERSAARPFSGRPVPDDRTCPFQRGAATSSWDAQQVAEDLAAGVCRARQMDS